MNDLEHEIRDALRRHENEAPTFEASDARGVAGRSRHRQILNAASVGIGTLVLVIGLVAGLNALGHDRPPTVVDLPLPSPTCVATRTSTPVPDGQEVHDWPGARRNPAGVYSWAKRNPFTSVDPGGSQNGSGETRTVSPIDRWMHNGNNHQSGAVNITFAGVPGRLVPHRGQCAVNVAGYEGTYRRFIMDVEQGGFTDGPSEEWMVDIRGTTVTITLTAEPGARETELAEAHEIIESISMDPQNNDLGFRLIFTIPTNSWDSG